MKGQIKFDFFRILFTNSIKVLKNRIILFFIHFINVQVSLRKKIFQNFKDFINRVCDIITHFLCEDQLRP